MKKFFYIVFALFVGFHLQAQIFQQIHQSNDTITLLTCDIDSMWFDTLSSRVKVVRPGWECSKWYNLTDISKVNFSGDYIDSISASCGALNVLRPGINYGNLTDQEGNSYKTITIGGREWMAENLRTRLYRNGDSIPKVSDVMMWQGISSGAWVFWDNNNLNDCPYGKLYNWYAVNDSRNLCPTGWHVPQDAEWNALENALGGSAFAGEKLKSTGTRFWQCPNALSNNSSGFSGLPGGGRIIFGGFYQLGYKAWFWTSTNLDTNLAFYRELDHTQVSVYRNFDGTDMHHGMSVRCIKDQ
jgi:uncharacterized protein (TIGR02145 family)